MHSKATREVMVIAAPIGDLVQFFPKLVEVVAFQLLHRHRTQRCGYKLTGLCPAAAIDKGDRGVDIGWWLGIRLRWVG